MTEEQIKSLQSTGGDHLAATEKNILGNHLPKLWETVKDLRHKTGARVDFVLDNAGFELYCDMVYGEIVSCMNPILRSHIMRSGLPNPEWIGQPGPFPRQALRVVRFGCNKERLGLAAEHHVLRASFPQGL
jgi:hypothetical protein